MKLDMRQVYQQLLLDEESKQHVLVNTSKSLFKYNCLLFVTWDLSNSDGEYIAGI